MFDPHVGGELCPWGFGEHGGDAQKHPKNLQDRHAIIFPRKEDNHRKALLQGIGVDGPDSQATAKRS